MCFADFIRDDPATGCPEPRTKDDWQAFMEQNGRVGASLHRQVYISQCGWYILTSDVVKMLAAFIGKRKTIEVTDPFSSRRPL